MTELAHEPRFTRWPADGVITFRLEGHVDYKTAFNLLLPRPR